MSANLTREHYCPQCGANFTMWYEINWDQHVIGCQRCGVHKLAITDRDLATLDDDHPLIQAYTWMIEHGRREGHREVAHG